jgi:hypothetical protein
MIRSWDSIAKNLKTPFLSCQPSVYDWEASMPPLVGLRDWDPSHIYFIHSSIDKYLG